MPSMDFLTRLKDVAVWHDWNQPPETGLRNRLDFHQKVIDEFFDLFALASNELKVLEENLPSKSVIWTYPRD